jgi:hypothetical protein
VTYVHNKCEKCESLSNLKLKSEFVFRFDTHTADKTQSFTYSLPDSKLWLHFGLPLIRMQICYCLLCHANIWHLVNLFQDLSWDLGTKSLGGFLFSSFFPLDNWTFLNTMRFTTLQKDLQEKLYDGWYMWMT